MANNNLIPELTEKEFETFRKQGVVLIDFFAEWCMPCMMMSPIMEELSEKFSGKIRIGKVDISENQAIAEKFGVSSIPTFIIFKEGKIVKQFSGLTSSEEFSDILNQFVE
jgi:thioredoxin 1